MLRTELTGAPLSVRSVLSPKRVLVYICAVMFMNCIMLLFTDAQGIVYRQNKPF